MGQVFVMQGARWNCFLIPFAWMTWARPLAVTSGLPRFCWEYTIHFILALNIPYRQRCGACDSREVELGLLSSMPFRFHSSLCQGLYHIAFPQMWNMEILLCLPYFSSCSRLLGMVILHRILILSERFSFDRFSYRLSLTVSQRFLLAHLWLRLLRGFSKALSLLDIRSSASHMFIWILRVRPHHPNLHVGIDLIADDLSRCSWSLCSHRRWILNLICVHFDIFQNWWNKLKKS